MKKLLKKGFTLLELLIVIVILGLLVSLVSINFLPTLSNAYVEVAKQDIARLQQALVMFKISEGSYPTQEQGLSSLKENPGNLKRPGKYPSGGYINKLPKDPWGNDYVYIYPGQYGEFDIISLGADGQPGGEGENADIGNWTE
ncbi:MAG: type II secretion system protein GspG [Gammaproteobacteria bacterium]|jgi:general secretion pathway protein G|nr:type II secretion system protein GspG [Gammaproteobacteria bacterium]|tara:strand:- start:4492 stop:4920 length:429 start_codon:yes stop_codon:yes gene_type:complete